MKISNDYYLAEIFGSYALLPVGQGIAKGKKPIKINESSYVILKLLENDISYEELLLRFMKEIECTIEEKEYANTVLSTFIESIKNNGVLVLNN